MNYFLDTNICVYFLIGLYPNIGEKIKITAPKNIKIPSIVKAELLYGAQKSQKCSENIKIIRSFLEPFEIVAFNDQSTFEYASLRAHLEKKGKSIGPNDYIVAAIALANKGILVTNNVKEFQRIKQLKIENWVI